MGRCEGRKPYGYYEGEARTLEKLRALRAEGLGFDRIAAQMNEERIPTRTGRPWPGGKSNTDLETLVALSVR